MAGMALQGPRTVKAPHLPLSLESRPASVSTLRRERERERSVARVHQQIGDSARALYLSRTRLPALDRAHERPVLWRSPARRLAHLHVVRGDEVELIHARTGRCLRHHLDPTRLALRGDHDGPMVTDKGHTEPRADAAAHRDGGLMHLAEGQHLPFIVAALGAERSLQPARLII